MLPEHFNVSRVLPVDLHRMAINLWVNVPSSREYVGFFAESANVEI